MTTTESDIRSGWRGGVREAGRRPVRAVSLGAQPLRAREAAAGHRPVAQGFPPDSAPPSDGGAGADPTLAPGQAFRLRVCLDLHLSALLMLVRAVALDLADDTQDDGASPDPHTGGRTTPGPVRPIDPRTRRVWLADDLELACRLASAVAAAGVSLPGVLGADTSPDDPHGVMEHLAAHYDVIAGLLENEEMTGPDGGPAPSSAEDLRDCCARRLTRLGRPSRPVAAGAASRPRPPWVPGEYFG